MLARLKPLPREQELKSKRVNGGLTFDEATELMRIQREQEVASNLLHDERTEARSFPPDRINFHE